MLDPRIRAAATTGLLDTVAEAGGEPRRVLLAADMVAADLADPDRLIDMRRVAALFEAAAREANNDLFGLQMSLMSPVEIVGSLSYLMLNAPTVETALRNLERYSSLHMPGAPLFMERDGSVVRLVLEISGSRIGPCRQLVEACLGFTLMLLRSLTGQELTPREVLFAHTPAARTSAYVRVLGSPVSFRQPRNELLIDCRWLAHPIASADRTLLPIVERHVREVLEARENEDALINAVRELVAHAVCDGHPNIAGIARNVGMSARTLQRRLRESGNTFKTMIDEVRSDLAREYLAGSSVNVTEVAFLLGYSELSAFDRAFSRWTGKAPLDYRRAALVPRTPIET